MLKLNVAKFFWGTRWPDDHKQRNNITPNTFEDYI